MNNRSNGDEPLVNIDADPQNANWLRIMALEREYREGSVTREEVEERLKRLAGDHWRDWLQRIIRQT